MSGSFFYHQSAKRVKTSQAFNFQRLKPFSGSLHLHVSSYIASYLSTVAASSVTLLTPLSPRPRLIWHIDHPWNWTQTCPQTSRVMTLAWALMFSLDNTLFLNSTIGMQMVQLTHQTLVVFLSTLDDLYKHVRFQMRSHKMWALILNQNDSISTKFRTAHFNNFR